MATDAPVEPKSSAWLKPFQLNLLALSIVALVAYLAVLWLRKPDEVCLLWRDPMGVKMTVVAIGGLAGGASVYLAGCALLNRCARVPWGAGANVAQVILALAWIVFCLPVAYVVTVGPAAIQIQRNLIKD
jgi:hypothetical protein